LQFGVIQRQFEPRDTPKMQRICSAACAVYPYDGTTQLCHFVGYDVPQKYAYRQPEDY
jgi:hypothetical protein